MPDTLDDIEDCIYEGRIDGVFKGFRNHDTVFRFQGGANWRQDEFFFAYHYLYSPKAKIIKVIDKKNRKELFYIEVDGVKHRVLVKSAYL